MLKKNNLINLSNLGLPIPKIVTLDEALKNPNKIYIVRSCGKQEDSYDSPAPGIFKSVKNTRGERILEAVGEVINSFESDVAKAYMKAKDVKIEAGYFIQEQIAAKASAVVSIQNKHISIDGYMGDCENITNGKNTFTVTEFVNDDMNVSSLMNILRRLNQGSNKELEMVMDSYNKWWIVQIKYKK